MAQPIETEERGKCEDCGEIAFLFENGVCKRCITDYYEWCDVCETWHHEDSHSPCPHTFFDYHEGRWVKQKCVGWGESSNPIDRVKTATDGVHPATAGLTPSYGPYGNR